MTTEAGIGGIIHPTDLLEYHQMGLKVVGIAQNGLPTMHKWGEIYEKPSFWTKESILKQAADFRHGVGTCFGETNIVDEQGLPLYLNCLDIDCEAIYHKLFILLDPGRKHSLIKKLFEEGFVVKTKKLRGYHIYWFSHKQYKPIHTPDCKKGFEFEIKTDKSSGTTTLPPSRHRNDPNFEYKSIAGSKIPISDEMYDVLIEVLQDCLKPRPEKALNDYQVQSGEQKNSSPTGETKQDSGNGKSDGLQLENDDVERIRQLVQPIYKQGCRNSIVFSLSCVFRRQGFSKDSVIAVIEKLAKNDGISQEIPDIKNALRQVEDVFKEDIAIIAGNEHLRNIIYSIIGSRDKTSEIFKKVFDIIRRVQGQRPEEEQLNIPA